MTVRSLHAPVVSASDAPGLQPSLQPPRALRSGNLGQKRRLTLLGDSGCFDQRSWDHRR